ncbi:MAG TPA: DUF86 domain-containing protein [Gemmatimonadales bacterium]|jgi:uncharacterized protein with HEPN domain
MPRDDTVYLVHMLETARKAVSKVAGLNQERFRADENLNLALVHLIQMMGEAARRVSDETQRRHPGIPWRQVIGMRHRVVHDYLAVDLDIVWAVVQEDLPRLVRVLEDVVSPDLLE